MNSHKDKNARGIVLVSTLLFLTAMLVLLGTYFSMTNVDMATTRAMRGSASGFYAAEAGLNLRAADIKTTFVGYNRPSGSAPSSVTPCVGADLGAGDFSCRTHSVGGRNVISYVDEDPSNPIELTIPPGELYQNLHAQEYRYTVESKSQNSRAETEALLRLRFKSRLVPLFQFVAFYNKDLEILPGATMVMNGPVHTNGDLYLNTGASLTVNGQISTAGDLYRGRKNTSGCDSNPIAVYNPLTPANLVPTCVNRVLVPDANLAPWNGMIQAHVDVVTVPPPEALDPSPGEVYWDKADLRLAVEYTGTDVVSTTNSATGVVVLNADRSLAISPTAALNNAGICPGTISGGRVVGTSSTFYSNREGKFIKMLEIDMRGLLNCIDTTYTIGGAGQILGGRALDDSTEGGLVFHFSHSGPNAGATANAYGTRIRNADELQSTIGGAPLVRGLTMVTDQASYLHGHFNRTNKIPAALLTDSFNALSQGWNLNDVASTNSSTGARVATSTTMNVALLAGTDSTGNTEGAGGQGGAYNGGLENYPRFHENWTGRTFTYRGSFVSLNTPRHVSGNWIYGNPQYTAPNRDWDYDTDFNDAAKLPPLSPRFVYLRQELFVRQFEQ